MVFGVKPEQGNYLIGVTRHSPGANSMSEVNITTFWLDYGGLESYDKSIPFLKRVSKEIKSSGGVTEERTALEELFTCELKNLKALNKSKNPFVPRLVKTGKLFYEMEFVYGESGDLLRSGLNLDTQLIILNQSLEAVQSVLKDGFINLEHAPKNMIVKVDFKNGKPLGVILLDWGLSYPVDSDGSIEIDVGLLRKANVRVDNSLSREYKTVEGLVPPEARIRNGKIKINAEKALVWSLSTRVIFSLFQGKMINGYEGFYSRCTSHNPNARPTLSEFITFFTNLAIDKDKIESCVDPEKLTRMQKLLGTSSTEITINERKLNKALQGLPIK